MISGPLLGLYLLGMLFRTSNSTVRSNFWLSRPNTRTVNAFRRYLPAAVFTLQGGLVGMTLGLLLTLWVGIGGQIFPPTADMTIPLNISIAGCNNTMGQNYTTSAPWTSAAPPTSLPE